MTWRRAIWVVLLCLALALHAAPAVAQSAAEQRTFTQAAAEWQAQLDRLALQTARPGATAAEARHFRNELARLRDRALRYRQETEAQVQATRALLDALGPAPPANAPPEPANVAAQRKQLAESLATFEGRSREADLASRRADALLSQLGSTERAAFLRNLLEAGPVPILPATIWQAGAELTHVFDRFGAAAARRAEVVTELGRWNAIAAAIVMTLLGGWLAGWPLRRWLSRTFGRNTAIAHPSYSRRLGAAVVEGVAIGLVPSVMLVTPLAVVIHRGLILDDAREIATGIASAAVFLLSAAAVVSAALAPKQASWRLAPLDDVQAGALALRIKLLALAMGLDFALDLSASILGGGPSLRAVYGLVSNSINAALLLSLMQPRFWRPAGATVQATAVMVEGEPELPEITRARPKWMAARLVAAGLILAVPGSSLAGYTALSDYLTEALGFSALLLGAYMVGGAFVRDASALLLDARTRPGAWFRRTMLLDDAQSARLRAWIQILFDTGIGAVALLLLLTIWGIGLDDLFGWLQRLSYGIPIGRYTLAPGDIGVAAAIFLALIVATRMTQRFLADRVLPQTRLDRGAQHSIRAAVGYTGLTVAALAGISALGIDLSNLAIIVGALGVGIGFGLQTIVNNFFSGLILLAERPIKVGDVVTVGDQTGTVRAINVRATEIVSADGKLVIVPNAALVSGQVVNLTHRWTPPRVDIKLGVDYGADPAKVMDLLNACALANPRVLPVPLPMVLFTNFGAASLDFELRVHVNGLADILPVGSELRLAINRTLRENGVEFAHNRLDVALVGAGAGSELASRAGSAGAAAGAVTRG